MSQLPDLSSPEYIGLTTTVPVEVILAAGLRPVDLNNIFITSDDPMALVRAAELDGYPRNVCGWIKGIYAVAIKTGLRRIIAVTQGDCSQTHAMIETWQARGIQVIPFAYPYDRDENLLRAQIQTLCDRLGTTWQAAESQRLRLRPIRQMAQKLDELTWREGKVTSRENHLWLVSCSDFNSDPDKFAADLRSFLQEAQARKPSHPKIRLGYIGVPPIITDLYDFIESLGARVVFNEMQRQFAMLDSLDADLLTQYLRYTYPYDIFARLRDINKNIRLRRLDGIIHYVQSFCFRQIQDLIIKKNVPVPVLTIEGDTPGPLDARTRLRIEAFIETLLARKSPNPPNSR